MKYGMIKNEVLTIVGNELNLWKERLAGATEKINALPSSRKRRLTPYLRDLDMMLAEMEDRIEQIVKDKVTPGIRDDEPKVRMDDFRNIFNESGGVHMDYDYSG